MGNSTNSQDPWISHFFEDVSNGSLTFDVRRLKTTPSTSHLFEDVSGESPIFEDPKIRPSISTSSFSEDVSGETLIFSIRRLKREPPPSRLCEDVSSETLVFLFFVYIYIYINKTCSTHEPGKGCRNVKHGNVSKHLNWAMGSGNAEDIDGDDTGPGAVLCSAALCRAAQGTRQGTC